MSILKELAQGLGPSLRDAGGVYSPQVFMANEQRYQQSQLLDARRKENAFSVLVNAIESGAIDPVAGQQAISKLGFDVGGIGPSAQAKFRDVQMREQQRLLSLEQQADAEEQRLTQEYETQLRRMDQQDKQIEEDVQAAEPLPESRPAPPQLEFEGGPIEGVENRAPEPEPQPGIPQPAGKTQAGGVQMQATTVDPETTSREQLRYAIEVNRRLAQSTNPIARKRGLDRLVQLQKLMAEQQEKAPKPFQVKVGKETWTVVKDPSNTIKERLPSDPSYGVLGKGEGTPLVSMEMFDRRAQGKSAESVIAGADSLQKHKQLVGNIEYAEKLNEEGMISGTGAAARLGVIRLLDTAGIGSPQDAGTLVRSDAFSTVMGESVLARVKELGYNPSNVDLRFIETMMPRLEASPDARRLMLGFLKDVAKYAIEVQRSKARWLKDPGNEGSLLEWEPPDFRPSYLDDPMYQKMTRRERALKGSIGQPPGSARTLPGLSEEETREHDRLMRELQ